MFTYQTPARHALLAVLKGPIIFGVLFVSNFSIPCCTKDANVVFMYYSLYLTRVDRRRYVGTSRI